MREELSEWLDALRRHGHELAETPALLFQLAANEPDSLAPATAALRRHDSKQEPRPWIQWINKPQHADPCLLTLLSPSTLGLKAACAFSNDGQRIVSGFCGTLHLWSARSGLELSRTKAHGEVTACRFSPDDTRILSGSTDGTVRIWDADSAVGLGTLETGRGEVSACSWSPDGRWIVALCKDQSVHLWDAEGRSILEPLEGWGPFAFSEDGTAIVSLAREPLVLDLRGGSEPQRCSVPPARFRGHRALAAEASSTTSSDLSPGGRHLLTARRRASMDQVNPELAITDVASRAELAMLKGHRESILGCAFSPDGRLVVSASLDGAVKVWDWQRAQDLWVVNFPGPILHLSQDASTAVVRLDKRGTLEVWNPEDEQPRAWFRCDIEEVTACDLSPDESLLAVGFSDGAIRIWDVAERVEIASLEAHETEVTACAFSADGAWLASTSYDLKIWDCGDWSGPLGGSGLLGDFTMASACAFSPCGRWLCGIGDYATILTVGSWDRVARVELSTMLSSAPSFSPDGRYLAVVCKEVVVVLETDRWRVIAELEEHTEDVTCCAFSPDSSRMVSGSHAELNIWDTEGWSLVAQHGGRDHYDDSSSRFYPVDGCAYSEDGQRLLVWTGKTVRILSVADLEEVGELGRHPHRVAAVAISPDGRQVVSGSLQHLLLQDAATGTELTHQQVMIEVSRCCGFSRQGDLLLTGDDSGRLVLFRVEDLAELGVFQGQHESRYESGHRAEITGHLFSPDGGLVITTARDGRIILWDGRFCRELGHHRQEPIPPVPEVGQLRAERRPRTNRRHETHGPEVEVAHLGVEYSDIGLRLTPDGRRLVSVGRSEVRVWDLVTQALLATHEAANRFDWCDVSPDGRWLVAGGEEEGTSLLAADDLRPKRTLEGNEAGNEAVFSLDGRSVVALTDPPQRWDDPFGTGGLAESLWERPGDWGGYLTSTVTVPYRMTVGSIRATLCGRWITTCKGDLLEVCHLYRGGKASRFSTLGDISALAAAGGESLALGDSLGHVYILRLRGLELRRAVVTAVRLYRFDQGDWDGQATAECCWCGARFPLPSAVGDVISAIARDVGLAPEASPCAELPAEAWNEEALDSACPSCSGNLRFNPFVVDDRCRYR